MRRWGYIVLHMTFVAYCRKNSTVFNLMCYLMLIFRAVSHHCNCCCTLLKNYRFCFLKWAQTDWDPSIYQVASAFSQCLDILSTPYVYIKFEKHPTTSVCGYLVFTGEIYCCLPGEPCPRVYMSASG